MTHTRVALFVVALVSSFALPVLSMFCVALSSLRFRAYEMLCIGLCIDFLFAPLFALPLATLCSVVLVWGMEPLRGEFA